MNMGCCAAAEMIRGKSTAEIRRIYNIKADDQSLSRDQVELLCGGELDRSCEHEQAADAPQQNKPKSQQQQKKSKKQKKKRH